MLIQRLTFVKATENRPEMVASVAEIAFRKADLVMALGP